MYTVRFEVYIVSVDDWGIVTGADWKAEYEEQYDSLEEAEKAAESEIYGDSGDYVKVYINDDLYRTYNQDY